ncbi:uncharacterized protein EI90DRAFT_2933711 [Cantharellus anzutake]|uniref:uncharacterized protein n=1 Tax=Cantharellus anzutake TaxID=1750568 RepID=UPI0019034976|nr:uncharacterized protein EI90DRAFT_2940071 [Cantharellus anzutake]XP_038911875.1 uncharacterized protein EI90DRAFT_2933711 [Cantharellus anzutake]KAF8319846.1 hypothetical protein EI90DRAFT_2940071 [Cantharellus anzutake]KAF8324879.1 hypothetical protein EI90DRAFT_2933711 [Cantharellus anzutake]
MESIIHLYSQDSAWKDKERGDENRWAHEREQQQLAELRARSGAENEVLKESTETVKRREEIEGGYGGQEDLEDRYATTSGEH